ncbi:MAG: hypothetical protein JXR51_15055 [Bacteroidales bacterium]|nr:hypothetical protein [Bacteroidales bacterium]
MRIFSEFFVFILLIVLIYILLVNIFGKKKNFISTSKVKMLFKKIDKKYEAFLKKNVENIFLTSDNYNNEIEKLVDLSFTILKPEIKSIYTVIKLSGQNKIKIDYNSIFFENSIVISEALYNRDLKINQLKAEDEDNFYYSFKESITSDLIQRLYNEGFDKVNQSIKNNLN